MQVAKHPLLNTTRLISRPETRKLLPCKYKIGYGRNLRLAPPCLEVLPTTLIVTRQNIGARRLLPDCIRLREPSLTKEQPQSRLQPALLPSRHFSVLLSELSFLHITWSPP